MRKVGGMEIEEFDGLQIREDLVLERMTARLKHIVFCLLVALILASLLGLFGRGPLADASAEGEGLRVEYERFTRTSAQTVVRLEVGPRQPAGVKLWLSQLYLEEVELVRVWPAPSAQWADAGRLHFEFERADPTQPLRVEFHVIARRLGRLLGEVGLAGGAGVKFDQLAYP